MLRTLILALALAAAPGHVQDAWDIAAITAFFALSNRIANFSAMMPNDEFYSLGRTPPAQSARPAR